MTLPVGLFGEQRKTSFSDGFVAGPVEEAVGIEAEILVQRHLDQPRPLQPGEMGISREGRRTDGDRVDRGLAEGADQYVDRVVGAAGDDQLFGADAVERGHGAP